MPVNRALMGTIFNILNLSKILLVYMGDRLCLCRQLRLLTTNTYCIFGRVRGP